MTRGGEPEGHESDGMQVIRVDGGLQRLYARDIHGENVRGIIDADSIGELDAARITQTSTRGGPSFAYVGRLEVNGPRRVEQATSAIKPTPGTGYRSKYTSFGPRRWKGET